MILLGKHESRMVFFIERRRPLFEIPERGLQNQCARRFHYLFMLKSSAKENI